MFTFRRIVVLLFVAAFLLAACSGQKPGETKQTVNVDVSLTEFGIKSSLTEFETGVPYHFVVTNAGVVEHEFMIMPPLTQDQMGMHMDMTDLDKMALAMVEASNLQAGQTASFDLTFTEPANSGELEFACHTQGHYESNMKLPISVQ
ncbi:MAG: hypothetical protein QM730_21365 [Anaerolineales bacterium]